MSRETFWQSLDGFRYEQAKVEDVIDHIRKHGGTIIWSSEPQEPPPPAVCTCSQEHKDFQEYMRGDEVLDFGKPGPWHDQVEDCPLWTPF